MSYPPKPEDQLSNALKGIQINDPNISVRVTTTSGGSDSSYPSNPYSFNSGGDPYNGSTGYPHNPYPPNPYPSHDHNSYPSSTYAPNPTNYAPNPTTSPNAYPLNAYPSNAYPPNAYPPNPQSSNAYPPNAYPPNPQSSNAYPPNAYPPNPQSSNDYPSNAYPPNAYPPNPHPSNDYPPNPQSSTKPRRLKIGGKNGRTEWAVFQSKPSRGTSVLGWECKVEIDAHGRVSGSNKNDTQGGIKKVYSGSFTNGFLRLDVDYPETGEKAYYSGVIPPSGQAQLEFKITRGVKTFKTGDHGTNVGIVEWEDLSNWKVTLGGSGTSGSTIYVVRLGRAHQVAVSGWTAELTIDAAGNVTGANGKKTYHGTYRNGWLDIGVDYTSGAKGRYTGPLPRSGFTKLKFDFQSGDNQDFKTGDWGWNVGKIAWHAVPDESLFQNNPVNVWVDDPNTRMVRCSGGQLEIRGQKLTKLDGKEWSWTTTNQRMSQGLFLCNIRIVSMNYPANPWKFLAGILAEREILQPVRSGPFSRGYMINAMGNKLQNWTSGHGESFAGAISPGAVITLMLDFNHPSYPSSACLSYLVDGKNIGIAFYVPKDTYYFTFGLIGSGTCLELLN